MNLSAPTQIVFVVSLVVAIVGVIAAVGALAAIPIGAIWIMTVAYIILAAGCLCKGV